MSSDKEELALTKVWGSSESNVLGIENFDDDYLFALRCLLEGRTAAETLEICAAELADEYTAEIGEKIEALYKSISASDLFKSLFAKEFESCLAR